jgi:hypothetical protein
MLLFHDRSPFVKTKVELINHNTLPYFTKYAICEITLLISAKFERGHGHDSYFARKAGTAHDPVFMGRQCFIESDKYEMSNRGQVAVVRDRPT